MSVADQIRRIKNAKAAIKEAIQNKGVTVSDEAKIDEYPALINSITVGSGSGESGSGGEGGDCDCEYINPDFFELITENNTSYRGLFYYYSPKAELDLSMLDSSNVTDMSYMFDTSFLLGSGKLINLKSLDFSKVRTINYMFDSCYLAGVIDLSGISFPELTDAKNVFYSTSYLTAIDMSNVDMPKVTDASAMFSVSSTNKMTSLNLTGINMPNLTNANNMFYYCNKITSLDVSGINFSKVTNANALFYQCATLVDVIGEIDFSSLTNGIYPSSTGNLFRYCAALETLYLKNIYKNVTTMKNESKWSINLGDTKVKDECLVYIIDQLPNLADKGITNNTAIKLTLPTVNTLTDEQKQVARDKGWIVVN